VRIARASISDFDSSSSSGDASFALVSWVLKIASRYGILEERNGKVFHELSIGHYRENLKKHILHADTHKHLFRNVIDI
jgi:hypothetical protein